MNLQIAICDDEPLITEIIKEKLLQYNVNYKIQLFLSGEQLLESKIDYDLIFLDYEMPELNGMEVAKKLRNQNYDGHIVFLTSHTEFALDAYTVGTFRFLRKPIEDKAFEETLRSAEVEILANRKLIFSTSKDVISIQLKEIVYLEAAKNITYIHTTQGEFEVRKSLSSLWSELGDKHFCLIHKSYIVAFRHIKFIDNEGILLTGISSKIPISRKKVTHVKDSFITYMKKYAHSI